MKIKRTCQHRRCYRWLILGTLFVLLPLRASLYYVEEVYADKVELITQFPSSSQILDRHGVLLYEFFGDIRRIPVERDQIPQALIDATLMAEDERFYKHTGFDPLGILRAFWRNWQAQEVVEGGSTLVQQLVKNTILGPSQGYGDKLEEIFMSVAVDLAISKEDILHLYLNTIPYGSNVYGAEAASRLYFDKHASELSVAEAATLAALPKHPTYLSPFNGHVDALIERRDYILAKMYAHGYIDELTYSTALSDAIRFGSGKMEIKAPHFVMHIRQQLEEALGKQRVEQGGLVVTTTLDYHLQLLAMESVQEQDERLNRYNADSTGLVALDPRNGEILAMLGNKNYFEGEAANVNMTTANRQPGSSFKPLVYAALLDKQKVTPASILMDAPRNFSLDPRQVYIPQNYDLKFRGPITLRDALAQSLNVPAVEAVIRVGVDEAIDFAEDLGITTLEDRKRFGPSIVLGGAEVKLLDLVSAYGTFANQGTQISPTGILSIQTLEGERIDWKTALPREIVKPETAYQITSILSDNRARTPVFGARSPLSFYDRQVAAKTGTSQDYRDAWTIGYTPSIAVGVWAGNHDNAPLRYGGAGAVVAAPVWRSFMDKYLANHEPETFEIPPDLKTVRVYTAYGPRDEYVAPWQTDPRQGAIVRGNALRTGQ